jgi:hypothetical protein
MNRFHGFRSASILLALVAFGPAALADERPGLLRAGAAVVDITPSRFPVVVNGMFTERLATRAYDPALST